MPLDHHNIKSPIVFFSFFLYFCLISFYLILFLFFFSGHYQQNNKLCLLCWNCKELVHMNMPVQCARSYRSLRLCFFVSSPIYKWIGIYLHLHFLNWIFNIQYSVFEMAWHSFITLINSNLNEKRQLNSIFICM